MTAGYLEAVAREDITSTVPELGGGDGGEVGGVGLGDADPVGLEVLLSSIQTLRRELIVAPGAEELTHHEVSLRKEGKKAGSVSMDCGEEGRVPSLVGSISSCPWR
jgi:hypothetical protein